MNSKQRRKEHRKFKRFLQKMITLDVIIITAGHSIASLGSKITSLGSKIADVLTGKSTKQ
jgi:hypothetical protein